MNLEILTSDYLEYCNCQKKLSDKTLKAYKINLNQFLRYMEESYLQLNRESISNYIVRLHTTFKPKTVKRKIACLKAFFSYLEYEEILLENPFLKLKVKFKEPFLLPKTIPTQSLNQLFNTLYEDIEGNDMTDYKRKSTIRDIAVLETLFGTGLRVSELCSIKKEDISLHQGTILINGKGSKERVIQITNSHILAALYKYMESYREELANSIFFFINRLGNRLSEQSVRFMIKRYTDKANIKEHLTPHMFRHTFATMLLEEDVDIRYIQRILGHSSILTTQIYTHVTSNKQREILTTKHPRNKILI